MDSTISEREKEVMIRLLKSAGVEVSHWGNGACMIKLEVAKSVYVNVQLGSLLFEEDYPHPGEA